MKKVLLWRWRASPIIHCESGMSILVCKDVWMISLSSKRFHCVRRFQAGRILHRPSTWLTASVVTSRYGCAMMYTSNDLFLSRQLCVRTSTRKSCLLSCRRRFERILSGQFGIVQWMWHIISTFARFGYTENMMNLMKYVIITHDAVVKERMFQTPT